MTCLGMISLECLRISDVAENNLRCIAEERGSTERQRCCRRRHFDCG